MIIVDCFTIDFSILKKIEAEEELVLFCNDNHLRMLKKYKLNIKKSFKCSSQKSIEDKIFGYVMSNYQEFGKNIVLFSTNLKIRNHSLRFLKKRDISVELEPTITFKSLSKNIKLYYDLENISGVKAIDRLLEFIDLNNMHIDEIFLSTHKPEFFQKEIYIINKISNNNMKLSVVEHKPDAADKMLVNILKEESTLFPNDTHVLFTNDNGFITEFSSYCILNNIDFHIFYSSKTPVSIFNCSIHENSYLI